MKFKKKYLLSLVLIAGGYFLAGGRTGKNTAKTPANAGAKNVPELIIKNDTINIDTINFDCKRAAGTFFPPDNTVTIHYFNPACDNPRVLRYCNKNNAMRPLTTVHEAEHARKAAMVTPNMCKSPYVRSQLAAINEIVAPVAEIIKYTEDHYAFGLHMMHAMVEVAMADTAIIARNKTNIYPKTINFKDQEIADLVMHYATKKFLNQLKRGTYRHAIDTAPRRTTNYTPNRTCYTISQVGFMPELNMWAPMWEFETRAGTVNIWNSASKQARDRLIAAVDSVINPEFAGNKFIYKRRTR